MIRISSIILSVYFLVGTVILPNGDFGFTSQISKLYDSFVQVNGITSYDEFLTEELLDAYSPPEDKGSTDEPFEKECHPVPIDLIMISANSAFYVITSIIEVAPEPVPIIAHIPYSENYTSHSKKEKAVQEIIKC